MDNSDQKELKIISEEEEVLNSPNISENSGEYQLKSVLKQPGQTSSRSITNHVSICQNEMEIIGDESPPKDLSVYFNVYSTSSSNCSSQIEAIGSQSELNKTTISESDTNTTNKSEPIIVKKLNPSKTPEERKLERDKKKEEKKIKKFQREEEAKFHAIAESKNGRYVKYDSKIGEGGYKIVSRGFDKDSCRDIAWCEVRKEHIDSREKRQTMLKEVKIMLSLDHPNVVKCYDVLTEWYVKYDENQESSIVKRPIEQKGLVIIQELMNEGTLKGMIKKNFHNGLCILENELINRWWYQILDVLRYMHTRTEPPIMHRDVKSDNLFLASQPDEDAISVKIGDFGLATTINKNSQRKTMIGTIGFMAPEVYEEKYDIKVDIYAFGMMMLEVVTNRTPYDDCTNIIQVLSKSISKHLPDLIKNVGKPITREVILACVHPFKLYRPTAEELCEHPMFERAAAVVTPFLDDKDRNDTMLTFIQELESNDPTPVIGLSIRVEPEFLEERSLGRHNITLFFDVYQKQDQDISELMLALKTYLYDFIKSSPRRYQHLEKIVNSISLQIQYLIKFLLGERWRALFHNLLHNESIDKYGSSSNISSNSDSNKKLNSDECKANECNDTFNITAYSRHWLMFAKTTNLLEKEIENYCSKAEKLNRPYFFNISYPGRPTANCLNKPKESSSTNPSTDYDINNTIQTDWKEPEIDETKFVMDVYDENEVEWTYDTFNFISSNNTTPVIIEDPIVKPTNIYKHKLSQPIMPVNYQQETNLYPPTPIHHMRHFSEPSMSHIGNYGYQANSSYPTGTCLSASFSFQNNDHHLHQLPGVNLNVDSNTGQLVQTYNLPNTIISGGNYYYQHQQQQQQSFNYYYPQKLVLPQNSFYYPQLTETSSYLMQNNLQYPVQDLSNSQIRYPQSQSFTRSLPNSVVTLMTSVAPNDSIASSNHHSTSLTSVVNVTSTPIRATSSTTNNVQNINQNETVFQNSRNLINNQTCQNNFIQQNKVTTPPIIQNNSKPTQNRPVINNNTTNNPQLNNKQLETKSNNLNKLKKPKSRSKYRYLLKLIGISDVQPNGETLVTFDMLLPMNQMRFTCSLTNEINTMDVSNCVKTESGQIPGELSRKEILESLVLTVKKMCQSLLEDIHSIPLHEEYIFHPTSITQQLIRASDYNQLQLQQAHAINPHMIDEHLLVGVSGSNNLLQPLGSCASSRSLSRHPSNEELAQYCAAVAANEMLDHDVPLDGFCSNQQQQPAIKKQQTPLIQPPPSPVATNNNSLNLTYTSVKVPDQMVATIKSCIDKLQQPNCYGVIVVNSASNNPLGINNNNNCNGSSSSAAASNVPHSPSTNSYKVFEMTGTEHLYVGLPSVSGSNNDAHTSSYSVVRCPLDRQFIIKERMVYQNPQNGCMLLHNNGELSYLQRPCLVYPPPACPTINQSTSSAAVPRRTLVSELPQDPHQAADHVLNTLQAMIGPSHQDGSNPGLNGLNHNAQGGGPGSMSNYYYQEDAVPPQFDEPILINPPDVHGHTPSSGVTSAAAAAHNNNSMQTTTGSVGNYHKYHRTPVGPNSAASQTNSAGSSANNIQVECVSFEYIPPNVQQQPHQVNINGPAHNMVGPRKISLDKVPTGMSSYYPPEFSQQQPPIMQHQYGRLPPPQQSYQYPQMIQTPPASMHHPPILQHHPNPSPQMYHYPPNQSAQPTHQHIQLLPNQVLVTNSTNTGQPLIQGMTPQPQTYHLGGAQMSPYQQQQQQLAYHHEMSSLQQQQPPPQSQYTLPASNIQQSVVPMQHQDLDLQNMSITSISAPPPTPHVVQVPTTSSQPTTTSTQAASSTTPVAVISSSATTTQSTTSTTSKVVEQQQQQPAQPTTIGRFMVKSVNEA